MSIGKDRSSKSDRADVAVLGYTLYSQKLIEQSKWLSNIEYL